ncbi:MAG: hypothetical protein CFE21_10225 [Bacteroidetes bacterium B1(2017)]|nr:MAG: hypothetical protein CFE21_10225 [Bacteroidetes bacterium B1(2017)]
MSKNKWALVVLNLILVLALVNYSIYKKEKQLKEGKLILLALAPVDPRSLMQGDYLRLRYAIANNPNMSEYFDKRGYCVIRCDSANVGNLVRYQKELEPKQAGEYFIPYTVSYNTISIGADSYFFEEGTATKYAHAKYGGLRVDEKGNCLLVGLYSEKGELIE